MTWAIIIITVLFALGLGLRKAFPKLCAICFAVTATWILGFFYLPSIVLAILIGGSAVGFMYYLRIEFFKLPYLLTAFALIYFALEKFDWKALVLIAAVWLIFGLLYSMREGKGRPWFKKVVECCRNW